MMVIGHAGDVDPDAADRRVGLIAVGITPEEGDLTGSLFAGFNQGNALLLLLLPPGVTAGHFI